MKQIVDSLPAKGPSVLWEAKVGEGFAGGGGRRRPCRRFFHRQGDVENRGRGSSRQPASDCGLRNSWRPIREASISDHGPRCVPIIHQGSVYLVRSRRGLARPGLEVGACALVARCRPRIRAAGKLSFGVGSTPIVEGDKLLANVGGKKHSGIVGLCPGRREDRLASHRRAGQLFVAPRR